MQKRISRQMPQLGERKPFRAADILPYLPQGQEVAFDSRHWVYGSIDDTFPFAVTTRVAICHQQFIKIREMKKDTRLGVWTDTDGSRYNVRKLTPKECFRLMGVRDEETERMRGAQISDTRLYALAGNSIVVDVLAAVMDGFLHPAPIDDGKLF